MIESAQSAWFVVHTQVNAEAKAARNLLHQGFEIYLPRYLKRRSHARKIDKVAAPLFPRYIFVRIDITTQRWRAIQSTFGVSYLVLNGETPAAVPDHVIATLKEREDNAGFVRLDLPPPFKAGDKITMLAGAFTDCLGLVESMPDCRRVSILLDLLGRKVRVLVATDSVAAA